MKFLNKLLEMLEELFVGNADAYKLSFDIPEYFCEHYDEIETYNTELANYLNDTIPDICDEGEPCFDPTHMIAELKKVYNKVKQMIAET